MEKKYRPLREKLLAQRRAILEQHLNPERAGSPVETVGTGDSADAASNNDAKEMTLNVKESEKRALEVIEEALARMDKGIYGHCEECGDSIPEKRLMALPHARLCVPCQEKEEEIR